MAAGASITSLVSVAGWFHDTASVAPFYGGLEGTAARLTPRRLALNEYLQTRDVRMVPAYDAGNDRAGMFFDLDYYANPERGSVPAWRNEMAEFSWLYWLGFDGLSGTPRVGAPVLFVHGDDCVLPDNVEAVRDRLAGPAELLWANGTQTDFYDQPGQVTLAADAAADHFRRTLA